MTALIGHFMMILCRVSAIVVASPVFGRRNIPNTARIAMSIVVTYALFSIIPVRNDPFAGGILNFAGLCVMELAIGFIMCYMTVLVFSLALVAGYFIDYQLGFGFVQIFDVQTNVQVPVTGNLLNFVMLVAFFLVDGHLTVFQVLFRSFSVMPPGEAAFSTTLVRVVIDAFSNVFLLGVKVSMPVIAATLLTEAVLGVVIRSVPQMNMFVIGMPIKIVVGIAILYTIMPGYLGLLGQAFDDMFLAIVNALGMNV